MRITLSSVRELYSRISIRVIVLTGLGVLSSVPTLASDFPGDPLGWPAAGSETKPWTRWWWLGSAVDPQEITRELEAFSKAGLGGVEICPIYGAVGAESRYLSFLSKEWMAAFEHTLKEAKRLGLGVDLTTGTGWPFGGPNVEDSMASSNLTPFRKSLPTGGLVSEALPKGRVLCLRAESVSGVVDLLPFIRSGKLEWDAPSGAWTLLGLFSQSPIQKVKRAAPGGEGSVLDPFSPMAMDRYFGRFAKELSNLGPLQPRAHFHESFEYYQAAWTPEFPDEFQKRRGYDLLSKLSAFEGDGDPEVVARVRSDYRLTLDELHRDYLQRWHDHAHENGSITRNQAHGSPGNLLDHYAVSEIPETEIFQEVSEDQIPMLRFASSAAHVTGRKLSSSETFTWLDEHFQVRPAKLKDAADFVFLGGANHIFFHGIPYSPPDAGWPGWLFYASTHLGENGGLWRDLPALTGYLRRCQSILQSGDPTADALIYFPMEDIRARDEGMLP
ncbi:MAG: glycosyl hydrolase family 2, partial [Verrucomicrobiales bacterium VVV1]